VEEFKRRKIDFVREVINDGNVLMKVSGLDEFNGKVADNFGDESFVWDDDDDEIVEIGA
jgi:hypothetical protein